MRIIGFKAMAYSAILAVTTTAFAAPGDGYGPGPRNDDRPRDSRRDQGPPPQRQRARSDREESDNGGSWGEQGQRPNIRELFREFLESRMGQSHVEARRLWNAAAR